MTIDAGAIFSERKTERIHSVTDFESKVPGQVGTRLGAVQLHPVYITYAFHTFGFGTMTG